MTIPSRGEIWRADLDPVKGHEQGRVRPVLVISNNFTNRGPSQLVTIIPITTKSRPLRSFIRIDPPEGGLSQISYIISDQVRTISTLRLTRRFGMISPATLATVEERIQWLLGLG